MNIDPPEVSVQSLSDSIEEGSELVMTCEIQTGNPQDIITHFWEFEPKYPFSQSQAIPEQRENREVRIERTVYSDAGTYRCTAGNTVGSDTEEIQIVIHCTYELVWIFLCKCLLHLYMQIILSVFIIIVNQYKYRWLQK